MIIKQTMKWVPVLLAMAVCGITQVRAEEATTVLKMGDAAPELKLGEWYKGDPVTLDDKGTYIVECWATWCGPCIAAFPHLSEFAKANEGKATVIGVNVWERKSADEVKTFVAGQGDKMSYHVAADADGYVAKNWLQAAGQTGIPCAFVVSRGKVAWFGHPATLNQELLGSIIDGTCDVAALAKEKQKAEAAGNYFKTNVQPLLQKKDIAGAIGKLEEMKAEFPTDEAIINGHIERLKGQLPKE